MFASLFLAIAMSAVSPPQSPMVLSREDVKMSAEVGEFTWIVLDTRDTILVPTDLLTLTSDGNLAIEGESSVLTSTYTDAQGVQHTVTTDCRRFSSAQACVDAHAAMVAKMRIVFPPPPPPPHIP